jgi:chromosome segregation ATPase
MNITLTDLIAIAGAILGSMGTLLFLMWNLFNSRFDKIDERFESSDRKLTDQIENIRHELTNKIDTGVKDLDATDKALASKIENLEKLTDKIDSVEQKLTFQIDTLDENLGNTTEKLSEKISTTRDRISHIEGQLIYTKMVPFDFEAFEAEKPKRRLKTQG